MVTRRGRRRRGGPARCPSGRGRRRRTAPDNDDDAFHSRLQSVKRRVQPPEREHAAPFTCSFTPTPSTRWRSCASSTRSCATRCSPSTRRAASCRRPRRSRAGLGGAGVGGRRQDPLLLRPRGRRSRRPRYGEHPWSPASLAQAASGLLRLSTTDPRRQHADALPGCSSQCSAGTSRTTTCTALVPTRARLRRGTARRPPTPTPSRRCTRSRRSPRRHNDPTMVSRRIR